MYGATEKSFRRKTVKEDLLEFPEAAKDEIGIALSAAQFGGKHPSEKPSRGEGPGVFEIVPTQKSGTLRTAWVSEEVPKGIKTAQTDVELISKRVKSAAEDYLARYGK